MPFVRATVVSAERPTSAKPGDTAVIDARGTITGFVGGTCVETSVRLEALRALETGESVLLRVTPEGEGAEADRAGRVTAVSPCLSGGTVEIFLEPVLPAPLIGILGDAPIARALAAVAAAAGFDVAAIGSDAPPDGAAAVVVASHGRGEEPLLRSALAAGVPYVALVASRRRGAAVAAALGPEGGRLRTPAGLDIGAHTPGEVAVSILAEIIASRPLPPVPDERADERRAQRTTATAVDPVCGMSVADVESSLHAEHAGVAYWFCGPGCRDAFEDDPASYLTTSP